MDNENENCIIILGGGGGFAPSSIKSKPRAFTLRMMSVEHDVIIEPGIPGEHLISEFCLRVVREEDAMRPMVV